MKQPLYCSVLFDQGWIQTFPTGGGGGRKTKFPTISDKISDIDCKTIDPLLNLLFKSGQISDEMKCVPPK